MSGNSPKLSPIVTAYFALTEPPRRRETLQSLIAELAAVADAIVERKAPSRPAILAGKFRYAESAIVSSTARAAALAAGDGRHDLIGAADVERAAQGLQDAMGQAKAAQIAGSLAALEQQVETVEQQYEELAREVKAADANTRLGIYRRASALQLQAAREYADWSGQTKEAAAFLGTAHAAFADAVKRLAFAGSSLGLVVQQCLPPLTSQIAREGDPMPESGRPETDEPIPLGGERQALQACGNSWVMAKQRYGSKPDEMRKLANFRKSIVDTWMAENLQAKYGLEQGPGKGWVSVGTSDPTSDYDISINKHGRQPDGTIKYDYEMVAEFNAFLRQEFNAEGGTVFDTNLYASAPPLLDAVAPPAAQTNDVAALMKMRRYMTSGEFEDFRVSTMNAVPQAQRSEIGRQFAMADNNYRIVVTTLITDGLERMEKRVSDRAAQAAPLAAADATRHEYEKKSIEEAKKWLNEGKNVSFIASAELLEAGEKISRSLEHDLRDATLENTNEIYTREVGKVRKEERIIAALVAMDTALGTAPQVADKVAVLRNAQAELDGLCVESKVTAAIKSALVALCGTDGTDGAAIAKDMDDAAIAEVMMPIRKALPAELDVRKDQLGSKTVISRYFANEAYQSDGPFAHVVTATQAAEADATREVVETHMKRRGLSISDLEGLGGALLKPEDQLAIALVGREEWEKRSPSGKDDLRSEARTTIAERVAAVKHERQAMLSAEACLQSFNEQLGDFLKDLEHYGDAVPGKAIIQSSKYLDRLLDAVRLMKDKGVLNVSGPLADELAKQLALQESVKDELIAARKGQLRLVPKDPHGAFDEQEQRCAFACAFMEQKLGIVSLAQLSRTYMRFGIQVNAAARAAIARRSTAPPPPSA